MIAQIIRNILSVEVGKLNRKCQNMASQVSDRRKIASLLIKYQIKIKFEKIFRKRSKIGKCFKLVLASKLNQQ